MFKFSLGEELKDGISSLVGFAIGRTEYMTGCRQYLVKPPGLDKDGKPRESFWFDEDRLVATGNKYNIEVEAPGGPNLESAAMKK